MSRDSVATAENGDKVYTAAATNHAVNCKALFVGVNAVLNNLEVDGVVSDVRTTYIDVAGATFPAGTLIVPKKPAVAFTSFNMASGTITAID